MTDREHEQEQQPSGTPRPLGTEAEFVGILERMTADLAPRNFALYEELGERVDARPVAWGMAFADRAEVNFTDGHAHGRFSSAETVRLLFCGPGKLRFAWAPRVH